MEILNFALSQKNILKKTMNDKIENKEIWKNIPDIEGYQVSNLGSVKKINTDIFEKDSILNPWIEKGYFRLSLNGKRFKVHQLVAMAFLGHKPCRHKLVIDHIDSNPSNNRVENLRIVTNRENLSKERTIKSGMPTGVHLNKKSNKYISQITINRIQRHLGSFNTIEEASEAYQKALANPESVLLPRKTKGYYFNKKRNKYRAQIWINNKMKFIGHYLKESEAQEAYKQALKYYGIYN